MVRNKGKEAVTPPGVYRRADEVTSRRFDKCREIAEKLQRAKWLTSYFDVGGGGWISEEDIQDITNAEEDLYQQSVSDWPRPGSVFHVPTKQQEPAKSRPDLFPPKALQLAGQVLAFGEVKHPDEKWKGMTSVDHIGACWRHMLEHQAGNTYDSESGELHLAHAFVRLGMALDQYLGFR